jgi:guanylate kinase
MYKISGFGHQTHPLMIIISGPSGVGKDSVVKGLLKKDRSLAFVVTAASRDPREDEVHGEDYFFLTRDEFERRIEAGDFLEHAVVYGDLKGILKEEVQRKMDSGKDVVMRIDVQGAASVREIAPDALLIFLTTNNEDELIKRLIERKTETEEKLNLRIETAKQEMKRVDEFDYKVVNPTGKLDQAVENILAIIKAEHHAVNHRKVDLL